MPSNKDVYMSPELVLKNWAVEYEKPLITTDMSKMTDLGLRIAANLFSKNPAYFEESERLNALLLALFIANGNIERASMYSVPALMQGMQMQREVAEKIASPLQITAEEAKILMPLINAKIEEIRPRDPYSIEEYDVVSSIDLIVRRFLADATRITEIEEVLSY